jgi:hypothetical protein
VKTSGRTIAPSSITSPRLLTVFCTFTNESHVDLAGGWKCHNGYVSREPNDIRDDDKAVRAAYFRMVCQHRAERKSAVLTHFDEPKLP